MNARIIIKIQGEKVERSVVVVNFFFVLYYVDFSESRCLKEMSHRDVQGKSSPVVVV